jgi:hypothetical protein
MIAQSVAEIISRHVRLSVEGIGRMYLNVSVPGLQYETGIVRFFRHHRGMPPLSAALMRPMSHGFVGSLEVLPIATGIAMVQFRKQEIWRTQQQLRGQWSESLQVFYTLRHPNNAGIGGRNRGKFCAERGGRCHFCWYTPIH